ncbi:DNA ligase 1 isoform X2 [Trichoplusia ni]|nr:DNA ligase 1 isoform X2 [Trichoplusia ni]XP_026738273.1 DNA ligase 1 isoform X2 [Trichoplusia ni]
MEAVEEPPLLTNPVEGMKVNVIYDEKEENAVASVATDVCQTHKSNGVSESSEAKVVAPIESNPAPVEDSKSENVSIAEVNNASKVEDIEPAVPPPEPDTTEVLVEDKVEQTKVSTQDTSSVTTETLESKPVEEPEQVSEVATIVEVDNTIETSMERVTFQTEILIESVDNEIIDNVAEEATIEENTEQDTSNLLSELGQSIELSEALRSSDVTDNVKNNNLATRQEVFNKEELLDILEGNDEEQPENVLTTNFQNVCSDKILEAQLALQQLSRLKTKPRKPRSDRLSRSRKIEKKVTKEKIKEQTKELVQISTQNDQVEVKSESEGDSIVNDLVKEWDDEDTPAGEKDSIIEPIGNIDKTTEGAVKPQDGETKEEDISSRTSMDSLSIPNKTGEEGQPQRRLGRVIKKKVIFDPDNPDTFTKSKTSKKNTEVSTELDKESTPAKKNKTDQTFQRSKSKSPLSKLQWKKPSPKNCKQNKRLTEVDKLLMDEGAVNMIYQLTPEAPKGKKNMKTKAEFIKKIQSSSTPDSKEMKFRERKKESKYEDGEARKILGGKQRSSLSSSVKSPSVCEDFEAHSADDSIIYRRHSSSSYSSSCMSPRRLSDVETSGQNVSRNSQQVVEVAHALPNTEGGSNRPVEVFMAETTDIKPDAINKNDCLSIKEKLNSKLNLALNKRKHDNPKGEKPSKLKKVSKSDEKPSGVEEYKFLSVNFDQRLAEVCVQRAGTKCNTEVIQELEKVLKMIESKKNISVTLLTSDCGSLYSDLDLRPLLDDNIDKTNVAAYETAESIRSLLHTVEQHSKLICLGISGRCSGIGLALAGLSDVAMASESASFAVSAKSHPTTIGPGIAVLTAYKLLPQPLLNDLVVFGRRLPAAEALRGGLVSRTLWPENFDKQVLSIAKDIAAQPSQNILLKKQLLNLKKSAGDSTSLHLEKERDLLVAYWTSVEGQALLRAAYNAA